MLFLVEFMFLITAAKRLILLFIFLDRMAYVDKDTVRLIGTVVDHGEDRKGFPVTSQVVDRKKHQKKQPSGNPWTRQLAELDISRDAIAAAAEHYSAEKKAVQGRVRKQKKELAALTTSQTLARRRYDREKSKMAYRALKETRRAVRKARKTVAPLVKEQKSLNQQSYYWNKLDQAGKTSKNIRSKDTSTSTSTAPKITTFTWECHAQEDDVAHSNIDSLLQNCRGKNRQVVFAGTDYGLVKMSRTVAVSRAVLAEHQNYFGILAGKLI